MKVECPKVDKVEGVKDIRVEEPQVGSTTRLLGHFSY